MKISEIPVKETITSAEITGAYTLGMKNIYPDDKVPVYELQKFPLTAYISDVDLKTTGILVERLRNISAEISNKKQQLENLISKIQTINPEDVEHANLQRLEGMLTYSNVTSTLSEKFASHDEFQTMIDNVYGELYSAIEEMVVQVFTTSMYARQYVAIYDDVEVDETEYNKYQHEAFNNK